MEEADPEVLTAYYCFVNLGWPPSRYEALPLRERALIRAFVRRDLESRSAPLGR